MRLTYFAGVKTETPDCVYIHAQTQYTKCIKNSEQAVTLLHTLGGGSLKAEPEGWGAEPGGVLGS